MDRQRSEITDYALLNMRLQELNRVHREWVDSQTEHIESVLSNFGSNLVKRDWLSKVGSDQICKES